MKTGDLVRVTRASLGAPKGSVGLAVARDTQYSDEIFIYLLEAGKQRRFLNRHLEVINASR
jgi:hypothetical protein